MQRKLVVARFDLESTIFATITTRQAEIHHAGHAVQSRLGNPVVDDVHHAAYR